MSAVPSGGETEGDPMPLVAGRGSGMPVWVLVAAAAVAALLLFGVLDARRRRAEAPSIAPRAIDAEDVALTLPPLNLPVEAATAATPVPQPPVTVATIRSQTVPAQAFAVPRAAAPAPSAPLPVGNTNAPRNAEPAQRPVSSGSAVVVDNSIAPDSGSNARGGTAAAGTSSSAGGGRVRASMLANRATTVPQGTLIPAVLETGFDSTRAGFARATVSHNIMGFDGQRVLIPRGSRLIGEYQSDARAGQNRALIIWNRLIRPDGATIEIASPAADTVGRGGIKADVNNHFFQRFSGAILQSALNAGVNIASQQAGGSVVVALPYGGGGTSSVIQPTNIPPTLKVKPGTSISVFVARDLDFTDVENRP